MSNVNVQTTLLGLIKVWSDFSTSLDTVPILAKLKRGKFRLDDYQELLRNHRQQVIEGSRWIARAASSITSEFAEQRSVFLKHAVTEHRDYKMLEANYLSVGGKIDDILNGEKNIGTEAFHAFMYQRATEANPFDLLGAMFIIEGLGQKKSGEWGQMIKQQLALEDKQVSFLLYHSQHDDDHMQQFEDTLASGILEINGMGKKIIKTAKIVARLYRLQLEELSNY
ncbi:MAG: iron-containing redox enzyme family protein [Alphaproteobacteria bacterium]